jgi:hypothetical protein
MKMLKSLSYLEDIDLRGQSISDGFIAHNGKPTKAVTLSDILWNLPIIDLNDFSDGTEGIDGDIFLFLPRKQYYSLTNRSFNSIGIKELEVTKRRIGGYMMYLIVYKTMT